MYKLRCAIQNYHWGSKGEKSVIAELKKREDPQFEIAADEHYAEYWFGTHPSGPSEILVHGKYQTLKSFIEEHPDCLGMSMGKNCKDLVFLSKVLSVDSALSIQAHPDKKLAEQLHQTKPELYKDDNHKPEMAYALTPFVAMCGFRRAESIVENLHSCEFLRRLIGEDECQHFEEVVRNHENAEEGVKSQMIKEALHSLFSHYIEADGEGALREIEGMKTFIDSKENPSFTEQWVRRLMDTYPTDCGVFAPLLLNTITLNPGDSIYMGADIPHAYLQGEIIESMACSNNVVRAGLTPKAIDKETLLKMLTYECGDVEIYHPKVFNPSYSTVETPASEFMLEIIHIRKGDQMILPVLPVPRILIAFNGSGKAGDVTIGRGSILFQVASDETVIEAEEDMVLYGTHEKLATLAFYWYFVTKNNPWYGEISILLQIHLLMNRITSFGNLFSFY